MAYGFDQEHTIGTTRMAESFALVITAILGTTGIVSLTNSLALWGRRNRLRNSIKNMAGDLKHLAPSSAEHEACKASMSVQTLELASLDLIKMKPHHVWFLSMLIGALVMGVVLALYAIALENELTSDEFISNLNKSGLPVWFSYIASIVIIQIFSFQMLLSRTRRSFVAEAWRTGNASRRMILRHSNYLQQTPWEKFWEKRKAKQKSKKAKKRAEQELKRKQEASNKERLSKKSNP